MTSSTIVMKRPGGDLGGDDLVRGRQEVAGHDVLAGERPEDVLRHRHVGRRVDPVAGHVPEHDRQPPVAQGEVVVDIAADLEPRRRFVDVAELEAGNLGGSVRGRSERCIVSANAFCCA